MLYIILCYKHSLYNCKAKIYLVKEQFWTLEVTVLLI
jgi:hypothetical protein